MEKYVEKTDGNGNKLLVKNLECHDEDERYVKVRNNATAKRAQQAKAIAKRRAKKKRK